MQTVDKEDLKCKGIRLNVDPCVSQQLSAGYMESLVRDAIAGKDTNEIGKAIIDKSTFSHGTDNELFVGTSKKFYGYNFDKRMVKVVCDAATVGVVNTWPHGHGEIERHKVGGGEWVKPKDGARAVKNVRERNLSKGKKRVGPA